MALEARMTTILAAALSDLMAVDWTPWLALTRRQAKVVTLVAIGLILLVAAVVGAVVVLRRRRRVAEGFDEPIESNRPDSPAEDVPSIRVVDAAIANLLEQAAPIDGDERSADDLYASVVRITVELGGVSIPALQRRLHLDFGRATGFVDRMAEEGMLSDPGPGGKRRVTPEAQAFVDGLGRE